MQAFAVDMPLPEYTHPHGPLNLASAIAGKVRKVGRTHQTVYSVPDLGPKAYIATGRCVPVGNHAIQAILPLSVGPRSSVSAVQELEVQLLQC